MWVSSIHLSPSNLQFLYFLPLPTFCRFEFWLLPFDFVLFDLVGLLLFFLCCVYIRVVVDLRWLVGLWLRSVVVYVPPATCLPRLVGVALPLRLFALPAFVPLLRFVCCCGYACRTRFACRFPLLTLRLRACLPRRLVALRRLRRARRARSPAPRYHPPPACRRLTIPTRHRLAIPYLQHFRPPANALRCAFLLRLIRPSAATVHLVYH